MTVLLDITYTNMVYDTLQCLENVYHFVKALATIRPPSMNEPYIYCVLHERISDLVESMEG